MQKNVNKAFTKDLKFIRRCLVAIAKENRKKQPDKSFKYVAAATLSLHRIAEKLGIKLEHEN